MTRIARAPTHRAQALEEGVSISLGVLHELVVPLPFEVEIYLHDELRAVLPRARFELEADGLTYPGTADGDGLLRVVLPQEVARCRVRWSPRDHDGSWLYSMTVHLDLRDAQWDVGQLRRLHNLGDGPAFGDPETAVSSFQRREGIQETGQVDTNTATALERAAQSAHRSQESPTPPVSPGDRSGRT